MSAIRRGPNRRSSFHRIHYSIVATQGNSKYSTVCPVEDMIFGTHTDPMVVEPRKLGLERDPIPRRVLSEFLSPVTLQRHARNP